MKILIVSNMYPDRNPCFLYNGIFVKEQYDSLVKSGVDVDVFIIDGFKSKFEYIKSIFGIRSKMKSNSYDVIHIHYGLSGLFLLFNYFLKSKSKVVLTLHGGDILIEQGKYFQVYLTKKIIKKANVVLTLNDQMNSVVSAIRSDFRVAPCGVDTRFFNANLDKRKCVFLFPGSKSRHVKNYPLFKSIVDSYSTQFSKPKIVAIDGFNREEVKELLSTSACIIMTSHSEGSPQIIKEALSCDLPVLSVDVGDVKVICGTTPGTKIFLRTEEPNVIAGYINHVIDEAKNTVDARRDRIFELGLSQDLVVNKLISIYEDL